MNRASAFFVAILVAIAFPLFGHAGDGPTSDANLQFYIAEVAATEGWTEHPVRDTDERVFVSPEPVFVADDIERVSFLNDRQGHPMIAFTLTDKASPKLWDATSQNIGKRLAIVLDGNVVSAPKINSGIRKKGSITGRFDDDDLLRFFKAIVLRRDPTDEP